MRLIFLIVTVVFFASCTALKPAVDKNQSAAAKRASSPVFIENISTKSSSASNNIIAVNKADNGSITPFSQTNYIETLELLPFKFSILMDVAVEELTNLSLLSYMNEWYGTRYRFGGTTKAGIDCSAFSGGLLSTVFGVTVPRMAKDQYKVCERVTRNELQEGDLVFFHTTRKGISHVGVYLRNNKFIHASLNNGVVISDLNDPYYSRTFVAGGRARPAATTTVSSAN